MQLDPLDPSAGFKDNRSYRCEENEHFIKLPNVNKLAENKHDECHIPHMVPSAIVPSANSFTIQHVDGCRQYVCRQCLTWSMQHDRHRAFKHKPSIATFRLEYIKRYLLLIICIYFNCNLYILNCSLLHFICKYCLFLCESDTAKSLRLFALLSCVFVVNWV